RAEHARGVDGERPLALGPGADVVD
ncbi:MAG: hypothetical protein JWM10_5319, partial [Myxococcaceae bacterium]|nr:hypothetical protein [Myxococcaceae bacterium]